MSKSDDTKDEKSREVTESVRETDTHSFVESMATPTEKDVTVNVWTQEYPPKPTDGKS